MPFFFSIDKIVLANESIEKIAINDFAAAIFSGTILSLTEFDDENIIWNGEYSDTIKEINGSLCCQIKSVKSSASVKVNELSLNFPLIELHHIKPYLQKQFVAIGADNKKLAKVSYQYKNKNLYEILKLDQLEISKADDVKVKCKVCPEFHSRAIMRQYVAKHILSNRIPEAVNTCGFCGLVGCKIGLVKTSGSGAHKVFGPSSDCNYFEPFKLKPATKISQRTPATNRPVMCGVTDCSQCYWSYCMALHYQISHPTIKVPEEFIPSEKERASVLAFK